MSHLTQTYKKITAPDLDISLDDTIKYKDIKSAVEYIDPKLLLDVGLVFKLGENKHNKRTRKDWDLEQYEKSKQSLHRHVLQFLNGDLIDPEFGFSQLVHIVAQANILFSIEREQSKTAVSQTTVR